MPSTYTTNLGIEKIATGEQSGTWGTTTNTNFDLIDTAVNGIVSITLASAGTSGSPNDLPITDGTASNGRNKFIEFVDGGDLGATAYVQLTPNDAEKIVHIRNSLSGGRSIIVFQGTYNASNDFEIPNGADVTLKFDGAGTGATVTDVNVDLTVTGVTATSTASFSGATIDDLGTVTTADINGGTIDGTVIGGSSAAAGTFTTFTSTGIDDNATSTAITINSDEEVGVGATNPQKALHVVGGILAAGNDGSTSGITIDSTATSGYASTITHSDTGIEFDTGSSLRDFTFEASGSELMRIDTSTGNVGIGTASPDADLEIRKDNASGLGAVLSLTNSNTSGLTGNSVAIGLSAFAHTTIDSASYRGAIIRGETTAAGNGHSILFETSDTSAVPVERVRIDHDGRVGIGTTSPSNPLNVIATNTNVLIEGSGVSSTGIAFETNNTTRASIGVANASTALSFFSDAGSTETMRIDSSGNVGIGTSSPTFSTGSGLEIQRVSATATLRLEYTGANGYELSAESGQVTYNSVSSLPHVFEIGSSEKMRITSTGIDVTGTVISDGLTLANATYISQSDSASAQPRVFGFNASNNMYIGPIDSYAGGSIFYGVSSGVSSQVLYTGGSERMRIDSSGNVGIGETSPARALHVKDSAQAIARFESTSTSRGVIGILDANTTDDTSVGIGAVANDLVLYSGNLTEGIRLNSSGDVGIGESVPEKKLHVTDSAQVVALIESTNSRSYIQFRDAQSTLTPLIGCDDNDIIVATGASNTERMRIDSSGNVLVGKTSTAFGTAGVEASAGNGLWSTRSGLPALALNRLSTDGSIADFYKDGTTVGSIGSEGGDSLYIGSSDTGLHFSPAELIRPWNPSTNSVRDAAIDLGSSSGRFKDLYLSGGAYLGGTAAANQLDDYEEGSWTGTLRGLSGEPGTLVTATGYYVKIGRAVHWTIGFENINTTGYSGAAEVDGLPFQNAFGRSVGSAINYNTLSFGTDLVTKIESSATTIDLMDSRNSLPWASAIHNAGTTRYLWMTGTYQTNA